MTPVNPRRNRNLCGQVADDLGRLILSGVIQPGEALPQEEALCIDLGVSRTVIREAVKSLAAKGLLDSRPKRGTVVCSPQSWNFLDAEVLHWQGEADTDGAFLFYLTELRQAIEPAAAALAAERAPEEALQRIELAWEAMKRDVENVEAFGRADLEFHTAILHATGNPFFSPIANVIRASLKSSLRVTNRKPDDNRLSLPVHEKVVRAIRSRKPERARAAMSAHLDDAATRLLREVKGTSP